jgi:hypothetical protein
MITTVYCRRILGFILVLLVWCTSAVAQETPEPGAGQEVEKEREWELAASDIFRSLLVVYAPRGEQRFNIEARVLNSHSTTVVALGVSKTFSLGPEARFGQISPGVAALFGNLRAAPALTARYAYERARIEAALGLVQALAETNGADEHEHEISNRYDNISDGNHISYRVTEPFLLGFTWEHIQFRREQEWKYGIRAAYRIKPGWEITAFGLVPRGGELRLGLTIR